MQIPVAKPIISKKAKKYLAKAIDSGWVSSRGPFVAQFETKFAKYIGVKHAVATNSGTSAIHLALAALEVGKGDEVIVPASTMIATVLPVIYQGAIPVLVDSAYPTGNIDPAQIEAKITKKTKAIIVVHLYGHVADMDKVLKIAKRHNVKVIEDTAEATGAMYKLNSKWVHAGSMGDISCFSFYANKVITTGEGGMALTNSSILASKMRDLRNLDRTDGIHFLHKGIGFAYRMSNLQAALGLAQLEDIKKIIKAKRRIASEYTNLLSKLPGIEVNKESSVERSDFWLYYIFLNGNHLTKHLAKRLARNGIETRTFHVPLHQQPALKDLGLFQNAKYPVAEELYKRALCLPSGPNLEDSEIKFITECLKRRIKV